jgi:hypothetical protein
MPDNITEQILEDMEKQGFPLEVRATEMLKTHGWRVSNQEAYFDRETGKQRTVDIESVKGIALPKELAFQIRLIIECKKCSKPWVFYVSDMNRDEIRKELRFYAQVHIDKLDQLAYQKKLYEVNELTTQGLFQDELVQPVFDKLAHIAYEPFTNGQGNSIHKARMQVCNAIMDMKRHLTQDTEVEIPHYILLKPIIILDGQLYAYQDRNLNKKEGLYYSVSFYYVRFMIEVVTIGFLDEYLREIENNINNFQRSLKQ